MCCKCKGKSLKQGNERICLLFPRRRGGGGEGSWWRVVCQRTGKAGASQEATADPRGTPWWLRQGWAVESEK